VSPEVVQILATMTQCVKNKSVGVGRGARVRAAFIPSVPRLALGPKLYSQRSRGRQVGYRGEDKNALGDGGVKRVAVVARAR
jgi:hypothetical protein